MSSRFKPASAEEIARRVSVKAAPTPKKLTPKKVVAKKKE
jgi:hypothetical protein